MVLTYKFCNSKIVYESEEARRIFEDARPVVMPCWHSRFMMFLPIKVSAKFQAVTSAHNDGNFLEYILHRLGHIVIRGSSRKFGKDAIREILKLNKEELRLVITPDGPLGPRFKIKGATVSIAKKFDVPIVVLTYSASKAIVLNTWDRYIIPIPFISKVVLHVSAPLKNPTELQLEEYMNMRMKQLDLQMGLKVDY